MVRPLKKLLEKLTLTVGGLKIVESSIMGLNVSLEDNIPLGDGFLIATALENRIPVIVSNDSHIMNRAPKHGLIAENPLPRTSGKNWPSGRRMKRANELATLDSVERSEV